MSFTAFDAPNYYVFDLLLNFFPFIFSQPLCELVHVPHWFLRTVLLGVFLDGVVCEVCEAVVDVVEREVIVGEAKIALLIEPYFRRIEVLNEHPLSDIKLSSFDEQWILYIFLYYKLCGSSKTVICDIIDVIEAPDSSSSGHDWIDELLQLGLAIHTFLLPSISNCGSLCLRISMCFFIFSSIC